MSEVGRAFFLKDLGLGTDFASFHPSRESAFDLGAASFETYGLPPVRSILKKDRIACAEAHV